MPYFPDIYETNATTFQTTTFFGLNRALVTEEGEIEDMQNMTGDNYPVISTRARRRKPEFAGEVGQITDPQGMIGTDRLVIADKGKIYVDGIEMKGLKISSDEMMMPKHMVAMGAYVCIWPDKKYINLANPDDYGDMGKTWEAGADMVVSAMMTRKDGREYDMENVTISDTAPAEPEDRQLWLDTSGEVDALKQYSEIYAEWVTVATTYIKIQADGIGEGIKTGDVVFLTGVAGQGQETEENEETTNFQTEEFFLNSRFSTTHQGGTNWVSTTPTIAERTKTIEVTGIPEGATVTGGKIRFTASSPMYGARLLSVNGKAAQVGENEIPIEVSGNGEVSLLFRFQSGNAATVSGSHSGSVTFSGITLEVTWKTTGSTGAENEQIKALNGSKAVYGAGKDYIIVGGLLRKNATLDTTITMELRIPDLDYITESNNRLWGCSYNRQDGTLTNEIRACALGDFRNWYRFDGTSMDSYVVSVGSDGKFTGAYTVRGYPIFFKESCLHKISGTEPANYAMNTTMCRGVQEGSWRSLAMVGEILYYKARMDVMAYDGSIPYSIGEKLGKTRWYEASGAAHMDKYYLCMRDENVKWEMYVYDTVKRLWHKEDDSKARYMAQAGGDLYFIKENKSPVLLCIGGTSGEMEEPFDWMVRFGVFGVTEPNQKYISRFNIRAQMAAKTKMALYIQYDSDGVWHHMGEMKTPVLRTFMLPVVPRRCDHLQIMIKGKGDAKIYSISRIYDGGGDGGYGQISRTANA